MVDDSTNIAELERPTVEDDKIIQLFKAQDNSNTFKEMLEEPGVPRIAELAAAYYLRPSYINGSPAPESLEPGHPLRAVITGLDLESVEDPLEKHAFTLLQAIFKHGDAEGDGLATQMLDQQATAAMLVPGLLRKYGPETSYEVLDTFATYFLHNKALGSADIFAESLYVVGEGVATSSPQDENEAFLKLRLVQRAAYASRRYVERLDDEYSSAGVKENPASAEFQALDREFQVLCGTTLERDLGLSQEIANTTLLALKDQGLALDALSSDNHLTKYVELFSDSEVQQVVQILAKATELPSISFQQDLFRATFDKEEPLAFLKQFNLVLQDPAFANTYVQFKEGCAESWYADRLIKVDQPLQYLHELARAVQSSQFEVLSARGRSSQRALYIELTRSDSPEQYIKTASEALRILDEHKILKKLDSIETLGLQPSDRMTSILITQPEGLVELLKALSDNSRLKRLLDEPSDSLVNFMSILVNSGVDAQFLGKAASAVILDNYIPASRARDPQQSKYYEDNLSQFMGDLRALQSHEVIWSAYTDFVGRAESLSVKEQRRAVRVFKALTIFGFTDISNANTLDEIESALIDNFLVRLTDSEKSLTQEQATNLLEAFDGIAPLMTYAQRYMGNPVYKEVLAGLTCAVGEGTYREWKVGDGSSAAREEMIEKGYLPQNMTQSQYVEWITDRSTSSVEELVTSATATAEAIRSNLQLASVDIDVIAPGYSLDVSALGVIDQDRRALGQFMGGIHKVGKLLKTDELDEKSISELEAVLAQGSGPSLEILSKMLRGVDSLKQTQEIVQNARTQLEQARLLVRIANITPEEVAEGALLSEPDKKGVRKPQQKLVDAVKALKDSLPESLHFIPEAVETFLADFATESGGAENFSVEDTIDPKVTLEIGETPLRSCQHYETGAYNQGLIGYFGPEVKILLVRNEKGGIVARSILRVMEGEDGEAVLYAEPIYASVASPAISDLLKNHLTSKAEAMGVKAAGVVADGRIKAESKTLSIRKLKMPAVYSDSAGGVNTGSLSVSV